MGLGEWLTQVHGQLTPSEAERLALQARVDQVMQAAQRFAGIAERYPAGSFAKGTMLTGRKEADLVAVLAQAPTDRTLDELRAHLAAALRGHTRRVESTFKAARIEFTDGASVDLLPVARVGTTPAGPSVPRKLRHALSGIEHVAWARREIHQSPRHPAIRLLKRLRDLHRELEPLSSFSIEVLCVRSVPVVVRGLDEAVRLALLGVAEVVGGLGRLPDPADSNNDLLADVPASRRPAIASQARALATALAGPRPETIFASAGPR